MYVITNDAGEASPPRKAFFGQPAADYLVDVLQDEMQLATLLGWKNFEPPPVLTPNFWLRGTKRGNHDNPRLASQFLPRWRRHWSCAGELVVPFGLTIEAGPGKVVVWVGKQDRDFFHAHYNDFPTPDDAIRWAMCQAAILCLSGAS